MRGAKGVLGMVLWRSGILMFFFPCMIGMQGTYMDSDLLMVSVVI